MHREGEAGTPGVDSGGLAVQKDPPSLDVPHPHDTDGTAGKNSAGAPDSGLNVFARPAPPEAAPQLRQTAARQRDAQATLLEDEPDRVEPLRQLSSRQCSPGISARHPRRPSSTGRSRSCTRARVRQLPWRLGEGHPRGRGHVGRSGAMIRCSHRLGRTEPSPPRKRRLNHVWSTPWTPFVDTESSPRAGNARYS